jgi:dienelactone hydrolase
MRSRGTRAGRVATVVVVVAAAALTLRMGALEASGPATVAVNIGDGIPATLHLPEEAEAGLVPYQQPVGERPPAVAIAHGYSADRAIMSPMARSLARAGYAALTFDLRGHGSNPARFAGELRADVAAVVDWLETSPLVDGSRIAVLGHSMGAGAVLDLATSDPRPAATVLVSGGWQVRDEVVPDHVLSLVASGDPGRISDRMDDVAADLRAAGAEVTAVVVPGTSHVSILYSDRAVREVVAFLDPVLGVERAGPAPGLDDPRLRVAALYAVAAVALVGLLGALAGRVVAGPLATGLRRGRAADGWKGLVLLALALALTAPVMAAGGVDVWPIGAGQPVVVQMLVAGSLLWAARGLGARGVLTGWPATWLVPGPWLPSRTSLVTGAAAGAATFVVLLPLGPVLHRMVPTPTRLALWVVVALMALPFFAAFEALLRRGGALAAVGWGLAGRVLVVVVLGAGLAAGVLPAVIALVLPLFAGMFLLLEVFAGACYARGRDPAVIAVTESVVLAWVAVTFTPIG